VAAEGVAGSGVPTFNVGGDATSLLDLADVLVKVAGQGRYRVEPFPPERQRIDIGDFQANDGAFRAATGWVPKVRLNEGLARTVAFYRDQGRHYWQES